MTRTQFLACLLAPLSASAQSLQTKSAPPAQSKQTAPPQPPAATSNPPDENNPPEEDESEKPRTYPFDPLESDRNIRVGNFYMHKGTASGYRAALGRYEDATRYNPGSAEAFFKLGEAETKLKNKDAAKIAFQKVLHLAPASKLAREAQKKLPKD